MLRRRWGPLLDVLIWLGICGLLMVDSSTDPRPLELTGGLLLATVSVAAGRRLPVLSLAAGTTSGLVVLFDLGGRVPVWELFLMVSMGYFAGRRMDRARPALIVFAAVAVAGLPLSLVFGCGGFASWAPRSA